MNKLDPQKKEPHCVEQVMCYWMMWATTFIVMIGSRNSSVWWRIVEIKFFWTSAGYDGGWGVILVSILTPYLFKYRWVISDWSVCWLLSLWYSIKSTHDLGNLERKLIFIKTSHAVPKYQLQKENWLTKGKNKGALKFVSIDLSCLWVQSHRTRCHLLARGCIKSWYPSHVDLPTSLDANYNMKNHQHMPIAMMRCNDTFDWQ